MACEATGKASTGLAILVNQTPSEWHAKLQKTVETATHGAKFGAAKTCVDMILDVQCTLRSVGVPLEESAWMLGDNQSAITSSTIPFPQLGKRHCALSYHRVRSVVAHKAIKFCFVESTENVGN